MLHFAPVRQTLARGNLMVELKSHRLGCSCLTGESEPQLLHACGVAETGSLAEEWTNQI